MSQPNIDRKKLLEELEKLRIYHSGLGTLWGHEFDDGKGRAYEELIYDIENGEYDECTNIS